MANVWTHGPWVAKPGNEDAFVDAWSRFAREAVATMGMMTRPTLLRDRERPNVFKTFGPWPDMDTIERFRASDLFKDSIGEIEPLLESMDLIRLDEIDWS